MSPSSHRPSWLRELRVLWLTIGLLVVIDLVAGQMLPRRDPSRSLRSLIGHSQEASEAAVLMLGSSRLRPVLANEVAAASGGATVVNLAFNGGGIEGQLQAVRRFLTPEVLKRGGTRLVLLGTSVVDLNASYRNTVFAAAFWNLGAFIGHWLAHGTDSATRAWLYANPPVSWSGLMRIRTSNIRGVVRGLGLRLQGLLTGRPAAPPAKERPAGVVDEVLANATAREAGGARFLADIPPPTGSIYLRDFVAGGRHAQALEDLAAYLRGEGVAFAVVHIPVSDWYRSVYRKGELEAYLSELERVVRAADVPLFVLARATHGLEDWHYFRANGTFDGHHLTQPEGRVAFSHSLGAQVVTPLLKAIGRGLRPGFAMSRIEPLR